MRKNNNFRAYNFVFVYYDNGFLVSRNGITASKKKKEMNESVCLLSMSNI